MLQYICVVSLVETLCGLWVGRHVLEQLVQDAQAWGGDIGTERPPKDIKRKEILAGRMQHKLWHFSRADGAH